jgi:polyisoprenoid-binding protein YceI
MVTKVRGGFDSLEGSLHLDVEDPAESSATATIEAASINTHNTQRDTHLRTGDFLDAPNHPQITYRSTHVERSKHGYLVTGDLTIRGTTKPVTIDFHYAGAVTDPGGDFRVGFEGSTTINRRDWGVAWNAPIEAGGVLVSEKVVLDIQVSAVRVDRHP